VTGRLPLWYLAIALASCSSSGTATHVNTTTSTGDDSGSEAGADTWTSYAQGFFVTYCTSCHDAGDATGRNFMVQAKVENEKLVIRCGVAVAQDPSWSCGASPTPKQFPIGSGPKPSDADRTRLVAWITGGAP
jgi:hypothetical protein